VARWNEFHQGYRIVTLADGSEQRIAVLGEPFKEVSPGFLPRTLEQVAAGVENDARRPENRFGRQRLLDENERTGEPQPSLQDALDNLLRDTSEEIEPGDSRRNIAPVTAATRDPGSAGPTHPLTRRQRRNEQFQRIFGSREDIQRDDYESPLAAMYSRAYDRYRQAEERRVDGTSAAPPVQRLSGQERRDVEEQLLWGVMRDSQATSESLEREGDVWSYAPAAPRTGGDGTPSLVTSTPRSGESNYSYTHLLADRHHRSLRPAPSNIPPRTTGPTPNASLHTRPPRSLPSTIPARPVAMPYGSVSGYLRHNMSVDSVFAPATPMLFPSVHSLDSQPDRPPPMSDDAMTKLLACQVCYQQLADTAVLPCGHMVMCQWCADVVVPVRHSHVAVPGAHCPMCRRVVKQKFRIYM